MKKAFDQTVRDLKRGVNKKVLKVPSIEQKVLDATSNETWGPHGSLLADIAMASRNYHEYQMIMTVIWKRINDTGKNWRHVYKGLTVLEYLVANGSERTIDEIREHAYQITSLADFQYLDHTGRDQGSNVRKKSQSLVALVNDKEKIQEVRQKAAANWEKFHNAPGGMKNRAGSYPGAGGGFDDYGSRDNYNDKDKYSYGGEEYSSSRGRSSYDGGDTYGRRSRSSDRDRERERAYEDDGPYSSRESNEKADSQSHDGRNFERKSSEQNLGVPPSYEDAVAGGRSPIYNERDGETKSASPSGTTSHETTVSSSPAVAPPPVAAATPPPPVAAATPPVAATSPPPAATLNNETNGFDEFDPRASFGSFPVGPPTSGGTETDLFGSSSDPFSLNELALVPVTVSTSEPVSQSQTFVAASSAPNTSTQSFDDPFGDGPFRAVSSTNGFPAPPPQSTSAFGQSSEPPQSVTPTPDPANNFGFGGSFDQTTDILADLLPPPGPSQTGFQAPPELPSQTGFQSNFQGQPGQHSFQGGQPGQHSFQGGQTGQPSFQGGQPGQPAFQGGQPGQPSFQGGQPGQPSFQSGQPGQPSFQGGQLSFQGGQPSFQGGQPSFQGGQHSQPSFQGGQPSQPSFQGGQFMSQPGYPSHGGQSQTGGFPSQMGSGFPGSNGQPAHQNNFYGGFESQGQPVAQVTGSQSNTSSLYQQPQVQSLNASTGALVIVPQEPPKFETKSTVWADTLNRGLVNLNIAGSKTNPMSSIGVDFEALNRKEKRMEKPSATPVTSNITMGKAMGSGSGIGRAGAGSLRPQPNPMMGAPAPGYGGMNQPMGQFQMQPPAGGYPPPGAYNPMMGRGGGGYGQQPYGGGYR